MHVIVKYEIKLVKFVFFDNALQAAVKNMTKIFLEK